MEQLQIGNMSLNTCINFIEQQELIQKYNHNKSQPSEQIFAYTYMLKKILKNVRIGKTCTNCLKKNHFQAVCNFKKKNVQWVDKNETNMQIISVKKQKKKKKEKEIYGHALESQLYERAVYYSADLIGRS